MSEPDYEAKYRRLKTIVGAIISDINDDVRLMEFTAKRMVGSSSNCTAAADSLKRVVKTLTAEITE